MAQGIQLVSYTPPPIIEDFIRSFIPGELFYDFIVGPYGCIAPETLVITEAGATPIADITRPGRVLSWNARTRQFQLSQCGASFLKGTDYLYRVTTAQGVFDAAGQHRLLCADGEYRRVEDLHQGDVLASYSQSLQLTSEESCPLKSLSDVQHCLHKRADCQDGCGVSSRHDDQHAQGVEDNARVFSPQQNDAPGSSEYFSPAAVSRMDGQQEQKSQRNRLDLFAVLRQSCRSVIQSVIRGAVEVSQGVTRFFLLDEGLTRAALQCPQSLEYHQQEQQHDEQFLPTGGCEAFPSPSLTITKRTILSIARRDVKQEFWDIQVADTNNYVTVDGCIHHNSGKTTGNFFKIIHMAMLQAPSPLDGKRKTKFVVVRNTAAQLLDTTIPSWSLWFKDGQAGHWKATPKTFELRFGDVECDVLFRPLDTPDDVTRVLSLEVTGAVLDEFVEIPQEIVEALSARCGRYPQKNEWPETLPDEERGATNYGMWGASNPGNEDSWWYKMLVEELPENWKYFHQPSGLSPQAENLGGLKGGIKYYENLAKGKSEAWIEQFIHANWGYSVVGKPVVPTFSKVLHVSLKDLQPDQHLPLVIGYDPGVQHSALIFGQFDFYGRLHILNELVLEGYGTRRMVDDRLLPILKALYPQLEVIIAPDPAANSRTPTDETSSVQILRDKKYKQRWSVKIAGSNLLDPRLEAIEHYTTRITEKGPALVVSPGCKVLTRALASGWKYIVNKSGNDRPVPDKNIWSHPGDAFGYLCQYGYQGEIRHGRRTNANAQIILPRFSNPYNMR